MIVSSAAQAAMAADEIITGQANNLKDIELVSPEFYDASGNPLNVQMSLNEALQAGEDVSQAARIASGTNNEYGVATIEGHMTSDRIQTYYNSAPVTSNHPSAIRWNVAGLDKLVAINHYHPNNYGFSDSDKQTYRYLRDTRESFRGVYMFDGRGNHRYGPRSPGFFGRRTFSCSGASASTWSCPAVGNDWKR